MSTWFNGPNVLGDALAQRYKLRWAEPSKCDIRHIGCGWPGGHDAAAMSRARCSVVAKTSKTGAISCGARISQTPWHISLNWSENNQMDWWPIVFQWLFWHLMWCRYNGRDVASSYTQAYTFLSMWVIWSTTLRHIFLVSLSLFTS